MGEFQTISGGLAQVGFDNCMEILRMRFRKTNITWQKDCNTVFCKITNSLKNLLVLNEQRFRFLDVLRDEKKIAAAEESSNSTAVLACPFFLDDNPNGFKK